MKLYYAQTKTEPKEMLLFNGQPLIVSNPDLFLFLIRINNEKAKFPALVMDENNYEVVELKAKVKEQK